MLRGLRETDVNVSECHADVWAGVEDKSQLKGLAKKLHFAARWILSYPSLVWRFLRQPKPDVVVIGYLGQLDVLVLWPFAKFRGVPVVWDAFISLYDTVVEDRKLVGTGNPLAWLIYLWEWLACRAADLVLIDTKAHGDYFVDRFHLQSKHVRPIFVGVETEVFGPGNLQRNDSGPYTVLFYGQFIPLHGIPTIVEAARLLHDEDIRWILIGKGQEEALISEMLTEKPLAKLDWIPWVPYEELIDWMAKANVCLGIFGDSAKASSVTPNKVFQILSAGKPLITRNSPAIRELLTEEDPAVWLVQPNNASALAEAVVASRDLPKTPSNLHEKLRDSFGIREIGIKFRNILFDSANSPE